MAAVTRMAITRPHSRTASGITLCTITRDQRDDAEVAAQQQASGQRVGHAALEDQVGVHQPVADDGPTEGQRKKDQRQAGQVGEQPRRVQVEQEGNRHRTA